MPPTDPDPAPHDDPVYGHPPEAMLGKPWSLRQRLITGLLSGGVIVGILVFVLWTLEQIRALTA